MNIKALFLLILLGLACQKGYAQIENILPGKYWQYSTTTYNPNGEHIYNFRRIPSTDSINEIAMQFDKNGTFKEVVTKSRPKPARNGKWHASNDTLVLDFPDQRWYYKIIFMNSKEFQCTMSK